MNANEHFPASQDALTVGPVAAPAGQRRVVALTRDPALSRALEELAGLNVVVVQTATLEALAEQVLEAGSAIALLDAAALDRPVDNLVDRLIAQFPDLRVIVAGHSLEQNLLATRISQGTVFRFVHKPASAQRLKLFVDAANRPDPAKAQAAPSLEPQKEAAPRAHAAAAAAGPEGPRRTLPMPALIGGAVALVAVIAGAVLFLGGDDAPAPATPAVATPAPAASPEVEELIRNADQAFAAQRFAGRDGNSAAELYLRASQSAPQDPRARSGLTRSVDFALRNAEIAFTEGRYADAEAAVAALQQVAPGNSRLAFLGTQVQRERERSNAEENRRLSVEARQDKLRSTLQQANERLRRGALIEPDRDSAIDLLFVAQDLAPGDSDVRAFRERLSNRLMDSASQKLDAGEIPAARAMLDAAGSLGADNAAVTKLRRRADELTAGTAAPRETRASEPAPTPASSAPATAATPPPVASTPPAATQTPQAAPAAAARSNDTIRIYAPSELTQTRSAEVEYPERALTMKTRGWAEVEFTIARDGTVKNVIVLNAEPKGVFESNTIQAVRRWRYKPVIENGTAIEARSRVRLRFTPAD